MLVLIRGAGDIATGIALLLWRSHIQVIMTDLAQPTAIRRTVAFSQAILAGDGIEDVYKRQFLWRSPAVPPPKRNAHFM